MTVFDMRHIRGVFPWVVAPDEVHFELEVGEARILLSKNGAGRSTLVKILGGTQAF